MSQGNRWDQIKASDRHGAGAYGQSSDGLGTTGHLAKFATGVITDNGNAFSYATDTGTANAYAVALSPAITLTAGDTLYFNVGHTNTGASTLALNGGSAIAIKKRDGVTALAAGDWTAGQVVEVIYDGTNWQWLGFSGSSGSTLALQTNGSANSLQTLLDLVAGSGITLSNSSGHTTIAGTAATGSSGTYNINFGILGLPTGGSVVLALHVFTEAVTFAGNFSGSRGGVPAGGADPTVAQTWTVNKIPSGSSTATAVGTVTISTAGVVAFTSTSGATVSFAAGDTITLVGSATADATLSYVDVVFQGLRASVTSTPIGVITFGWLGTVPASQIIGMYEFVNGMTFPANFSGAAYGKCLTNPTATWTATVQKNGSTVGTISVSTSGVFTFTSSGGVAVSFATGDLMTVVAQSSADSTFAYVAVSFSGSANGYVILGGDLGGTSTAPKVIGLQGVGISATAPTNGQELVYNSGTGLWTPATPTSGGSGSRVLLEQYTASGSAALNFTTRNATGQSGATIQSDYDEYQIELVNLIGATSPYTVVLEMSTNGGSSYDTGSNYRWVFGYSFGTGTAGAVGSAGDTNLKLRDTTMTFAANAPGFTSRLTLYAPLSTSTYKQLDGVTTVFDNSIGLLRMNWSGLYASLSAVNAFRVRSPQGNLASGKVRVYGIAP